MAVLPLNSCFVSGIQRDSGACPRGSEAWFIRGPASYRAPASPGWLSPACPCDPCPCDPFHAGRAQAQVQGGLGLGVCAAFLSHRVAETPGPVRGKTGSTSIIVTGNDKKCKSLFLTSRADTGQWLTLQASRKPDPRLLLPQPFQITGEDALSLISF